MIAKPCFSAPGKAPFVSKVCFGQNKAFLSEMANSYQETKLDTFWHFPRRQAVKVRETQQKKKKKMFVYNIYKCLYMVDFCYEKSQDELVYVLH